MRGLAAALFAVWVLVAASRAQADQFVVTLTVPSTDQLRIPGDGDSAYVYCSGGPETHDLLRIRYYRLLVTGGGWTLVDSSEVRGMEGVEISKTLDAGPGSWWYVTAVDTTGRNESCANQDVLYHGPVTSVPIDARRIGTLRARFFTPDGRKVERPVASGIYFWQGIDTAGRVVRRGRTVIIK